MTLASLAAFAGAIFVLFFTPGPGNLAMVARTLDAGPVHGWVYGAGIIIGDLFWLTVAVFGLAAAAQLASDQPGLFWAARLVGAGLLFWFAYGALRGVWRPAKAAAPLPRVTPGGLAATLAAGVAMPLTNPKPIVFYLAFLPAFFDLSRVDAASYLAMVAIMLIMFALTAGVHVTLADRARGWMAARGVRRWADLVTGLVLAGVGLVLLVR
ncbi:LysE family translocator [Alkalicaulis satelles]|uniref:LysE family translocator n=1 Tax=Alkalicaulis satelles TaxID=2609175 RepID=A0A5M6ZL95_9PROT|nr:LysE family translocator [Alkalicaulis satelles]KAA5803988.1 LysE family translocator [Alkalicaulis satelles]